MPEKKEKEKKESSPRRRRMKALGSVCIVLLSLIMLFMLYYQPNVGVWGDHYTIEDHHISTFNGWEIDATPTQNYSVEGVVLGERMYPYTEGGSNWKGNIDPKMIISPIDLFIGTGNVSHNTERYPYEIDRWEYKRITWDFNGDSDDASYFEDHVDNHHLIARNDNVYQAMLSIRKGDNVTIHGELVDVFGNNGDSHFFWGSGTTLADDRSQICFVSSVEINGIKYDEFGSYNFIPPFLIGRFWMQIYSAITAAVVISTLAIGTYYWERGRDDRRKKNKARTLVTRQFRKRTRNVKVGFDDVKSTCTEPTEEGAELSFVPCPQCGEQVGAWESNCLLCGALMK